MPVLGRGRTATNPRNASIDYSRVLLLENIETCGSPSLFRDVYLDRCVAVASAGRPDRKSTNVLSSQTRTVRDGNQHDLSSTCQGQRLRLELADSHAPWAWNGPRLSALAAACTDERCHRMLPVLARRGFTCRALASRGRARLTASIRIARRSSFSGLACMAPEAGEWQGPESNIVSCARRLAHWHGAYY
jgi:hypothetical protein